MVSITQRYLNASAWTLLVYDYFLTFESEVTTIWKSPWSIGIPLFYLNRYLPLVDEALLIYYGRSTDSAKTCEAIFKTQLWTMFVGGTACRVIIYLHACALWGRNRIVVFLLGGLLLATLSAWAAFIALQTANLDFLGVFDQPHATVHGCRLKVKVAYWQGIYISALATEAVTVAFMMVRGLQHLRQSRDSWVLTLYGNGILYCVVIILLGIINVVVLNIPAMIKATILLAPLQRTMESILCSRLMFVILQRQKVLHISGTGTEGAFGTGNIEEPGIPNSREVLTSFEEYPRHSVADGMELQASGRELSKRAVIGIYDQRW
ncbi:hypothetical protein DFP72DRAFT_136173 [Ephemerocybe angulata]|uniref:DUF6533 domain-containing protein n=1 Tax=Ephemerocybe angulata TaxID=980116 RepID=A0A8H6MB73_9AGAR|nr:hypothetical protein DFP72DRAFT_136173 [Tulosesus angulatus]